ncbi:MAG: hypothetical protein ACRD1N_00465 [Terriglobia bacterium]
MWHYSLGVFVPIALFAMIVAIVAIGSISKTRERELQAHHELRLREMEHERRLKELEIEKSKIELEKAKTAKGSEAVAT